MSNTKKNILKAIGIFAILLLLIFTLTFQDKGFYTYFQLNAQKGELQQQIDSLKKANDSLRKEIELLRNSPDKIEKVAREKYGLIKPGERVYKFQK